MREHIRHFVQICAETLPISEPIFEFGSLQVPGQEGFADLRAFFPGRKYVGADFQNGPGVDRVLDLHEIDLPTGSVGTALLLETLEHVEFPRKAMAEVYRILRPEGLVIASSVMNYPIHGFPSDYWRFTPAAFESLLRPFPRCFVDFAGIADFPHTVVGIGFKRASSDEGFDLFEGRYHRWKTEWLDPLPKPFTPLGRLARHLMPPLAEAVYKKIRGVES